MKKVILMLLAVLMLACQDDDNFVTPVSHTIQVQYDASFGGLAIAGASVKLVSTQDGKTYTGTSDANGQVVVEVLPGVYNLTASFSLTPEAYYNLTGQTVEAAVTFNGSSQNQTIANGSPTTVLALITGRVGNLVLKQIYYAGSDTKLGASYRDQFFELHNNSNETIYLDGLCFAQLRGTTTVPSNLTSSYLPNGQYDWSKSFGQTKGELSNSDYVYAEEVIRIPGTGQQYPLAAGKSVIVAATALNHKSPLTTTDKNGTPITYEVPEPDRTIDLSQAPFEAYFQEYLKSIGSNILPSDVDNPNSVNVQIVFKSFAGQDLILDPLGRDAFAIFYANDAALASWGRVPLPTIAAGNVTASTDLFLQIPNAEIIDGVDIQHVDPSKGKPKRLPVSIDAGDISNTQGQYSSESVRRKVAKVMGERVIYQDTNNSDEDFVVLSHPEVVID